MNRIKNQVKMRINASRDTKSLPAAMLDLDSCVRNEIRNSPQGKAEGLMLSETGIDVWNKVLDANPDQDEIVSIGDLIEAKLKEHFE